MRPSAQGPFRHPVSGIFRTEANVRALRALVRHGGAIDTGRLMREAQLTRQTVLRALEQLEAASITTPVGTGRYRTYRFNPDHPLASAMRQLFDAESARVE